MPLRCCFCGDNHDTLKCSTTERKMKQAMDTDEGKKAESVQVSVPAKCCNCNVEGHFASDPRCPRKMAYIQSRRARATEGRPEKKRNVPVTPSPLYTPGGRSYAEMLGPGSKYSSPSGKISFNLERSGPSGIPQSRPGPSGNFEDIPFSVEEITAMTFDIVNSLRDVRHLPRHDAFMAAMNVAFKYLYRDD